MKFESPVLRLESAGDPLWLYKVCVSLIKDAAVSWGHGSASEAPAAGGFIVGQIYRGDAEARHVLAPIVDALGQEAVSLNRVFRLFPGQTEAAVRENVRRDALDYFKKSSTLRSLHEAGKLTDSELNEGALRLVQALDKYGANGQEAMLHTWKSSGRNLLAELRASDEKFAPSKIGITRNIGNATYTRSAYYEKEYATWFSETKNNVREAQHQACLATIGPEYQAAIEAKESLLCGHIERKIILGSKGAVLMAQLHPNYERAQKAAIRGVEPFYGFTSPILAGEIDPEEGVRFMRAIDTASAKGFDPAAIVREIRGAAAGAVEAKHTVAGPAKPEGQAPKGATANPAAIEHPSPVEVEHSGHVRQAAEATHGHHTGTRLALGGAAGLALYDGLKHLREEPKPGDDPKGGTFRFARVLEVGIGAAGLAAAMLCKGATFEKLFGGRGK